MCIQIDLRQKAQELLVAILRNAPEAAKQGMVSNLTKGYKSCYTGSRDPEVVAGGILASLLLISNHQPAFFKGTLASIAEHINRGLLSRSVSARIQAFSILPALVRQDSASFELLILPEALTALRCTLKHSRDRSGSSVMRCGQSFYGLARFVEKF